MSQHPSAPDAHVTGRLQSLDVFRGFTIASMVLVNNPGSWSHLYGPLAHAPWNGWTFTDTIFPFFLFIAGVAMTLSTQRALHARRPPPALLWGLWRRAAVIIGIGLLLNFIPYFNLGTLRYPGVLQRIGVCVLVAAPVVVWGRARAQAVSAISLMALYAVLMLYVPVPDAQGVVSTGLLQPGRDTGAFVDRWLMSGHLWVSSKVWDPEGVISTLPAVASLLAGALCGRWLVSKAPPSRKAMGMLLAGVGALLLGQIMDAVFMPINKSLWTPSYAVFMSGWALVGLALCYWLIDATPSAVVRNRARWWSRPFCIYGVNALFVFALSGLVAKMMGFIKFDTPTGPQPLKALAAGSLTQLPLSAVDASLLFALVFNLCMFAVAWLLWRRSIVIKI